MRLPIDPEERRFFWWPFTGAPAVPSIQVGTGAWQAMDLDAAYDADPEVPGADWYRCMIAGPLATSNPAGTIVATGWQRVRFKVVALDGGEIDIQPDAEPIYLEVRS